MLTRSSASSNEAARLAAVHRLELLDAHNEPEFDEIVQLAADICDVPISIVSLIDHDRQWYISALGVQQRECPLDRSFCQYTIQQPDMLLVPDTFANKRFATHPAVKADPAVRFYAGIPIQSPDGLPVGTLCIADLVPRQMSPLQLKALRTLAHQTNARLELRQQRLDLAAALRAAYEANDRLAASEREVRLVQQQLQAANQRLLEMATTDPLTGLVNRRAFHERLPIEFAEARRHNRPLSLLLLDIDDFKLCNDRHGHDTGDHVLSLFAQLLRDAFRLTDLVVRYGGEEFLVLLPNATEADAMALSQRVLQAMQTAPWPHGPITTSIGCASIAPTTPNGPALVTQADEALYTAKRTGKNRAIHHNRQPTSQLHLTR